MLIDDKVNRALAGMCYGISKKSPENIITEFINLETFQTYVYSLYFEPFQE